MSRLKDFFGSLSGIVVWFALSSLLLPAALWLLLVAAGVLHPAALSETSDRWFALDLGMLLGGFGVWTAPIGLPIWLRLFQVPGNAAMAIGSILTNAWALSAALLGLSAYAAWGLRSAIHDFRPNEIQNALVPAAFLLLGTSTRLWIDISAILERVHFGKVSFEPDKTKCGPGEEAAGILTLEKKAASVEAQMEFYREDDRPAAVRPAKVGPAARTADGWVYRVTGVLPEHAGAGEEGGWVLTVKARGVHGGSFDGSINIEPGQ
jgi:hypothetical protein